MTKSSASQPEAQYGTAKVFMSGHSQAVRLPAAFRFSQQEVFVRRDPVTGDVTLSETKRAEPEERRRHVDEIFRALDAAGAAAFVLERDHIGC